MFGLGRSLEFQQLWKKLSSKLELAWDDFPHRLRSAGILVRLGVLFVSIIGSVFECIDGMRHEIASGLFYLAAIIKKLHEETLIVTKRVNKLTKLFDGLAGDDHKAIMGMLVVNTIGNSADFSNDVMEVSARHVVQAKDPRYTNHRVYHMVLLTASYLSLLLSAVEYGSSLLSLCKRKKREEGEEGHGCEGDGCEGDGCEGRPCYHIDGFYGS